MPKSNAIIDLENRMTRIETRCPLREEIVDSYFKQLNDKIDNISHILDNGLKELVNQHTQEIKEHRKVMDELSDIVTGNGKTRKQQFFDSGWKYTIRGGSFTAILVIIIMILRLLGMDSDTLDTLLKIFTLG